MNERTLVIIKPDAVQRGIIGDIISRFEKVGLKIVGAKMMRPDPEVADQHYPKERTEWVETVGNKTLDSYKEQGIDALQEFGTDEPMKIGLEVQKWLVDFISSNPVLVIALEGPHAVEVVRKIVGSTMPSSAQPGTIRGDYSFDSPILANKGSRPVRNLIHASGNKEEAEFELNLWFKPFELFDYHTVHQKHMVD